MNYLANIVFFDVNLIQNSNPFIHLNFCLLVTVLPLEVPTILIDSILNTPFSVNLLICTPEIQY